MTKSKAEVIYRKLTELKKLPNNPRTIKRDDMERLKKSIQDNPDYFEARPLILSDRTGELIILAGNQRYEAAKMLRLTEVPTVLLSGLTEEREREIIIRDNIENGEWDMDALANDWDVEKLQEWGLDEVSPFREIVEDTPPDVDREKTYSVVGEVYQLGNHRVYCGSFEDEKGNRLMFNGEKATCCFTDLPYNVNYTGGGQGKRDRIQGDNLGKEEFESFIRKAYQTVAENIVTGGRMISWTGFPHLCSFQEAITASGFAVKSILCWVKDHFTLGRGDFQNACEIALYVLGEGSAIDVAEGTEANGDYGWYAKKDDGGKGKFTPNRNVSNVWFFPKPICNKDHPTMKPIGLCAKGILCMSEPNDLVYDPFLGSGSTLIAAEQTGRACYGSEIEPKYVDAIRKRWVKFVTGSEDNWQELTPKIEAEKGEKND